MFSQYRILTSVTLLALASAGPAQATNGMNLEGYGVVATGMGGASMAYYNGNAGMINNPATVGFLKPGESRLALFAGGLAASVSANNQKSQADSYVMPAMGFIRKADQLTAGIGIMAQGGMGTAYDNGSFWGALNPSGPGAVDMADAARRTNMSEVGVGRVIFPLAMSVSEQLNIGASLDFVWAGMDVQWLMDGAHFADMMPMPGAQQTFGTLSGSMVQRFASMMGPGGIQSLGWGYFDFNRSGQYQQQATGTGWAANVGFTYTVNPQWSIGGVYHAKTRISDLRTGDGKASTSFNVDMGGISTTIPVLGQITVHDFQWPETWAIGMAWRPDKRWLLVSDYKRINWADTLRNFRMSFTASDTQSGMASAFAGSSMDLVYRQQWRDQNVLMLGASYSYSERLTLRGGLNLANNPVPDRFMSPLFPAIVTNHLTFGAEYCLSSDCKSRLSGVLSHAPRVSSTNQWNVVAGDNQTVSHSQTNWQMAYGLTF